MMGIVIPLVVILFTCLIIWRACDGFEVASDYIGRNMSEGVRGGTINAISSSIPELFTTLIALFILSDTEGFSIGLGTTAGSALFNGMIIPACCILFVVGTVVAGKTVTSVNVSRKVILRDGLALIFCNLVLIVLINGAALHWWQGLVLMLLYFAYFAYMILSMRRADGDSNDDGDTDDDGNTDDDGDVEADEPRGPIALLFYWLSGGPLMDLEKFFVRDHHQQQIKKETWNAWPLLLTSTACIGAACWFLVLACEWLGTGDGNTMNPNYDFFGMKLQGFGMPPMFVAVIFASMATSVPDTIISIRDAKDGDYDDAVANALGSNIFDICFALGFPLFLYTIIYGKIQMSPEVIIQSGEIRLLLLALTIVGFFVYYLGKSGTSESGVQYVEMGRTKAFILLAIYIAFVVFIIGSSSGQQWAAQISGGLQSVLSLLPKIG